MSARDIEDIYELSPLQAGMLFHTLVTPEAALYFEQFSMPWPTAINRDVFDRAWRQVVDRHAALRTSFHWTDLDKPLQVVHRAVDLDITWHDWRDRSRDDQDAAFERLLADDRLRGFDLATAPLIRIAVVRWSEWDHQILISVHHIVMDGWSMQIAFRDLLTCYQAGCEGREVRLAPVRAYGDYIGWLQRQDPGQAEAFWREAFAGFTEPTPLGVDEHPAPSVTSTPEFEEHECRLSAELTAALQKLAREHQLTLNTIVQAAWAILLQRYSGTDDVVFGTVVSGRPASLRGADEAVGLFINTIPVPTRVRSETTLLDYLRELQTRQAAASEYGYARLVDIHPWSGFPRGTPLFETLLVFENYPALSKSAHTEAAPRDTATSARTPRHIERTNLPLTVIVAPGERLSVKLVSESPRLASGTAAGILRHLETLLQSMLTGMDDPLGHLSLLTAEERSQLVSTRNATDRAFRTDQSVDELIAIQARVAPQATAVAGHGTELTYAALMDESGAIARSLQSRGIGSGARVGVCMSRSPRLVTALLGVMKSGAAYLPLDPAHPRDRLRTILEAGRVATVLTETSLLSLLPPEVPAVCVDGCDTTLETAPSVLRTSTPADPAYVIFTSGSTGRPKGVEVPHRALTNFVLAMAEALPVSASDRMLAVTTVSFDIAVLELLFPLTLGARVEIASREEATDGMQLALALSTRDITVMQGTPATWRLLLDARWNGKSDLCMLCGGEALTGRLATQLLPRGRSLWNLYGPTETTVWSTVHRVTEASADAACVSIGGPIANTQLYVLDREGSPVPVRVPGELYIGGAGVALGYFDDPDRTDDRFVPDPFNADPAARLYRTGDRVRRTADGTLEFLGRLDHQIKIRGYRVEPGEIEAILARHDRVRECVVIAHGDELTDRRLIAYVAAHDEPSLSPGDLRRFAEEQLPGYMVPSLFVALPALPRTASGKVDRRALPVPDRDAGRETRFVEPRTDIERRLAGIVADVLGVARVGINDDFFLDLGGHSLLATQLVSRISGSLGVELSLRQLFDLPTVSALAGSFELLGAPVAAGAGYEEGVL